MKLELQNVPPAPGRGETVQPSQPPADGAPAGPEGGGAPGGGGFGGMGLMLLMFLPMILIFFLLSRSQGKKQKELESKLKKGDRVIVSGGIIGRIAELTTGSKYAKIEVTSGVKIEVLKSAIQGLDTGDVAAASGKDKAEASKDKK